MPSQGALFMMLGNTSFRNEDGVKQVLVRICFTLEAVVETNVLNNTI